MTALQKNKVRSSEYKVKHCRICGSSSLYYFLDLGNMPIPNGYLSKEDVQKKELSYPLQVCVCTHCYLMQLRHVIPAEIMFKNYLYVTATSSTMVSHFQEMADEVSEYRPMEKNDLVIDIGSNDGTFLRFFQKKGYTILGIDPAENIAEKANEEGIPTECAFFSQETASAVLKKYGKAKIITAVNVFAHINDIHDVVRGIKLLLDQDGVFVIESPYASDLLEKNEFDTIYHEHVSYISLSPIMKLIAPYGLRVIDVRKQSIHGGSLRVVISHNDNRYVVSPSVKKLLDAEKEHRLHDIKTYDSFAERVKKIKRDLVAYLKKLKKDKKKIVGYGAAAKANVLLNFAHISTDLIDYIVDASPYKYNRFTPGTHIPIYPATHLQKETPDYILLFVWNIAEEILRNNKAYREKGGKFLVAIPEVKILH